MSDLQIPFVTADQMRRVDDLAENEFFLELKQMMENAGRGLARLSRERFLNGDVRSKKVLILAGPGGNGGGGMAAARRLHVWGANPIIILGASEEKLAPVPRHQLRALKKIGVPILEAQSAFPEAELILDALLGYSVKGSPRPPMDQLVSSANRAPQPILSLDLPTGLDPDSGLPAHPAIEATATMTLALPKAGLREPAGLENVGELWLADISIPPELYLRMGLEVGPIFAEDDLIRIN